MEALCSGLNVGLVLLADLLVDATQDNVVEFEEGGDIAQHEQVYAISHCLVNEGVASQHVVEHFIGHGVATRMQDLVDFWEFALHITQRLLDSLQVQAVLVHDPWGRPVGYRIRSTAAMVWAITCGAKRT